MANDDIAAWDEQFRQHGAVVLYGSKIKLVGLTTIAAAFTAAGILGVRNPRFDGIGVLPPYDAIAGWLAIAFFGGICIPPLLWKLASPRTTVRIDARGISVNADHVAWADISRIGRFSIQVLPILKKRAAQQRRQRQPWWRNLYDKSNGFFETGSTFSMPRALKGADAIALQSWLSTMHERYK